jgi:predicted RNase H-like HicB family nuclease
VISVKRVYPVILIPAKEGGYVVSVPDLEINTQGDDMAEAILMARDAIGLWGISRQDKKREIPEPSKTEPEREADELVSWVDVDFTAYRRRHENRIIRRNVAMPVWIDEAIKESNMNFSGFIQSAVVEHLNLSRP